MNMKSDTARKSEADKKVKNILFALLIQGDKFAAVADGGTAHTL